MTPWVVIDFESRSLSDLKKVGSYRYAIDPTTEVLCFAYENHKGKRGLWLPGDPCPFPQAVLDTYTFVCHQAAFERSMWTEHMVKVLGWPEIPIARWHDTMARALQLALPGQLEKVLKALNAPVHKDKEGSRLTVGLSKVNRKTGRLPEITPEILARVGTYCLSDIEDEVWLHKRLGWLDAHERPIWELSQEMNDLGIGVDLEYVAAAQQIVDDAIQPLEVEFAAITGGLKPSQRDKVLAWLREHGADLPDMTKETLEEWAHDTENEEEMAGDEAMRRTFTLQPHVDRALRIRKLVGSAAIKKLPAMKAATCFDGRAKGLMVYHGTSPGRQTAKLIQPHNFPRGTVKADAETLVSLIKSRDYRLLEAVYGTGAVEIIVSSLRHGLVATDGRVLLGCDYAGIQARSVLALAGQHDKTALMAAGADVYCDMASSIYSREITKADMAERQTGKNSVLGLGFQMGPTKFWNKYCFDQPFPFAERVVHTYRKEWAPRVPELWYALQDAAINTVWTGLPHEAYGVTYSLEDIWLKATIHNGSSIYYAYPERTRDPLPWDAEQTRKGFTYKTYKMGQWVTRHAFGGQLTENVIMKIEREIMETAKRRLRAAGYLLPFEVHDEALIECEPDRLDVAEVVGIMEDVEGWVKEIGIPIAVEPWKAPGRCYRK